MMNNIPLCVDLDGTLICVDTSWLLFRQVLKRKLWMLPYLLIIWGVHGRAAVKKALGVWVPLNPEALPYNEAFLAYLQENFAQGRTLILATGADMRIAQCVADSLGLFHHLIASDGVENCVGLIKAKHIQALLAHQHFAYAGNSWTDVAVWKQATEIILVRSPSRLTAFMWRNFGSRISHIFP